MADAKLINELRNMIDRLNHWRDIFISLTEGRDCVDHTDKAKKEIEALINAVYDLD